MYSAPGKNCTQCLNGPELPACSRQGEREGEGGGHGGGGGVWGGWQAVTLRHWTLSKKTFLKVNQEAREAVTFI